MAIQIQLRQGTTTEHNTFTGAVGEVTVDTTKKTLRVHDGSTVGGTILATLTGGLVPTTQLPAATTSVQGAVILNDTVTSTSATQALTAAQGKQLNDKSFGVEQSTKSVPRIVNTEYTNPTNKIIVAYFTIKVMTYGTSIGYCDGKEVGRIYCDVGSGGSVIGQIAILVPANSKYKIVGGEIIQSSELS